MNFFTKVQGIPCYVQVNHLSIQTDYVGGHPDQAHLHSDDEFDFILLDRRGRRAGWLERKVTSRDVDRFYEEALRAH